MSKYKAGDKFILEIREVIESERGTLYRSNFSTLVFDDYGLDNLPQLSEEDIAKLEKWKEDKVIKIGDEVKYLESSYHGVVFNINNNHYQVIWSNKTITYVQGEHITKTGRNFKDKLGDLISELNRRGEQQWKDNLNTQQS